MNYYLTGPSGRKRRVPLITWLLVIVIVAASVGLVPALVIWPLFDLTFLASWAIGTGAVIIFGLLNAKYD